MRREDLPLLLDLIRHPVRRWGGWHTMAVELFGKGGMTIDTPATRDNDLIGFRTLIQPDGDVVVIVDDASLLDEDLLRRHRQLVTAWYERSTTMLRQVEVSLRAIITAVAVVVAVTLGLIGSEILANGILRLALSALISGVAFPLLRFGAKSLAYALVRRRMDAWVGGAGAAG